MIMKINRKSENNENKRFNRMLVKISRGRKRKPEYEEKKEIRTALKHYHGGQTEATNRKTEEHEALHYEENANGLVLT